MTDNSQWKEEHSLEHDELLKQDYEGPKVLVSFAVMGLHLPEFYNVILNTGMPQTNKDLEIIKRGMANYVLGWKRYDYHDYKEEQILGTFIIDIKSVV
jgi:hypothetical protein